MKIFHRLRILALLAVPVMFGGVLWTVARERNRRLATYELLQRVSAFPLSEKPIKIDNLLARGADVNARDKVGRSVLDYAITRKDYLVSLLVERGADVNARAPRGETPLIAAAALGKVEIVRLLLARGAAVSSQMKRDNRNYTALTYTRHVVRDILPVLKPTEKIPPQYKIIEHLIEDAEAHQPAITRAR